MIRSIEGFVANANTTVVSAMQMIDAFGAGILFVIDKDSKLLGCITDGDIRRWIIRTADLEAPVSMFMTSRPVTVLPSDKDSAIQIMRQKEISAIPVVSEDGTIEGVILKKDYDSSYVEYDDGLTDVPVIIMAGGKGTRLYPYTKILPKPLIPIGDIPIIERIIHKFQRFGARKYYVTVNYKKEMIKAHFNDIKKDYEMIYVEEDTPLGTGGSIRLINERFDKPVIVTNCDILIEANYSEIYEYHKSSGNIITIVSSLKNTMIPYGVIQIKENGVVEQMKEKPTISHFINTGMYIVNPEAIERIPKNTFFHMTELIDNCITNGDKVGVFPISEDSYLDMGELEELTRMEEKLKTNDNNIW